VGRLKTFCGEMSHLPSQSHPRLGYLAGLDGFRGVSLVAVLLFHGGFGWAKGGFLGVTAFFVLSGFLITSLLLLERSATGRIDLKAFWVRRARRLVPAALLTLLLAAAYAAASGGAVASGLAGDAVAAAGWVANWRFVLDDQSYADLFTDPSPLQHFWSLAVEEQFYLVLPVAAVGLLGRGRMRRDRLALAAAGVVVVSTAAAALWHYFDGTTRAYYGTDARVAEPLVGVLLALLLVAPARGGVRRLRVPRAALDGAAGLALAGLAVLIGTVDDSTALLYRGGFLLTALLAAVLLTAATQPHTMTARLFSLAPLVAVGRISYGAYLFHWPVFLWLSPDRTGWAEAPLFALRTAVTLSLALASYALVERPVRIGRLPRRVGALSWANATVGALAALMAVVATAPSNRPDTSLFASAGDIAPPPSWPKPAEAATTSTEAAPPPSSSAATATAPATAPKRASTSSKPGSPKQSQSATASRHPGFEYTGEAPAPPTTPTTAPGGAPAQPPRLKVAVVGDSMALDLGQGLATWAEERGDVAVYNMAIGGCPLSRGGTRRVVEDGDFPVHADCSFWSDHDQPLWKYFEEFDPDVVVVHDGLNEVFDRKLPSWGEYRWAGDPRFDKWLLDEYSAALRGLQALGAVTLFLNTPCIDWEHWGYERYDDGVGNSRIGHLNDLAVTMQAGGVWTADLFRHLCPNGTFTETVDDVKNGRPDGYHLSDEAGVAVARKWLGPMILSAMPASPPEQSAGSN
jgi:peptidoglycan/LPS O-acetylase OafA/YrhL